MRSISLIFTCNAHNEMCKIVTKQLYLYSYKFPLVSHRAGLERFASSKFAEVLQILTRTLAEI
jgi:hypothetical protein